MTFDNAKPTLTHMALVALERAGIYTFYNQVSGLHTVSALFTLQILFRMDECTQSVDS